MKTKHRINARRFTAALVSLVPVLNASAQDVSKKLSISESFAKAFHDEQTSGTYYRPSLSNSTTRDPDPPKYAGNFSQSWLSSIGTIYQPNQLSWLDIGLDTRVRFEYRDNDLRELNQAAPKASTVFTTNKRYNQTDTVVLQRTRLYLGIKDIIDPFRFAVEIADSRRYGGSDFRPVPKGDEINAFEPIRLYGELYFKDLLGHDNHGNARPLSIRYGIHNFEFLDRRIIANNQWRNTANTFQGFHGTIGQAKFPL